MSWLRSFSFGPGGAAHPHPLKAGRLWNRSKERPTGKNFRKRAGQNLRSPQWARRGRRALHYRKAIEFDFPDIWGSVTISYERIRLALTTDAYDIWWERWGGRKRHLRLARAGVWAAFL